MRDIPSHRQNDAYSICSALDATPFLCGALPCKDMHRIVTIPVPWSYYASLREINNAKILFIMNGIGLQKIILRKEMYDGSYFKNSWLNKVFITLSPPVATLLFSDAVHSTIIPRPKCIYIKRTLSTYKWHSTCNVLPATERNSFSLLWTSHTLYFHHDAIMPKRALSTILHILPLVLIQLIIIKM